MDSSLTQRERGIDERAASVRTSPRRAPRWLGWARVSPLLRDAGHDVYTPTLTGLGERAHLLSPDIGLSTHIQDLVNVFEFEDIEDAILVAHSYGGVVASGAMELIHHRVRSLVFLDALLTRGGETVLDVIPGDLARAIPEAAAREGEGWYLPTSDASFMASQTPPTPCGSTAS